MKLIDTNILIYSAELSYSSILLPFITAPNNKVSVISRVEALGFHKITKTQRDYFNIVFSILQSISIEIRQMKKMTLGDSLIAATALTNNLEIITRNIRDFSGIPGLLISNPIPN